MSGDIAVRPANCKTPDNVAPTPNFVPVPETLSKSLINMYPIAPPRPNAEVLPYVRYNKDAEPYMFSVISNSAVSEVPNVPE